MNKFDSKFWDDRFSSTDYVYGTEPNKFFKEQIDKLSPGKILLLGEGEGRNGVYAAKNKWAVFAIDYSNVAKNKAIELAEKNQVKINYHVQSLSTYIPEKNKFNVAALIFLHLNPSDRKNLHRRMISSLLPGGMVILEVFEKEQLGKTSGGPQNYDMLYSLDEVKNDFKTLKTILLKKEIIFLNESDKHKGDASIITYVGKKLN